MGAAIVGTVLIADTVTRTRAMQERSINSLELLSRVVRDLGQERILVDDHIVEDDAAAMATLERRLTEAALDLQESAEAYTPLVEDPTEAALWRSAQTLIHRY